MNNINIDEISNRPLESFKRPGLSKDQVEKLYAASKKNRQGLLFIIQKTMHQNRLKNMSHMHNRSVESFSLASLSLTREEKLA